jgi:hypothetical protein
MDLIAESDIYVPCMNDNGEYVDKIPSFANLKNGLRCPCGTRRDKTYDCSAYFATHIKSQTHKKWLLDMNTNKKNYYTENVQLKETINSQKIIIARLEKDISVKIKTIDYLTQQLVCKDTANNEVANLLDFD